jgi:hypothetical protein
MVVSQSPSSFWKTLIKTLSQRGILFNFLFVIYFFTLQPALLRRLSDVDKTNQPDYFIGAIIFAAMLAELIGFWLKKPVIARNIMDSPPSDASPVSRILLALIPLCHIFLTAMMAITALPAIGLPLHGQESVLKSVLALVVFFTALSREGLWLKWLVEFFQDKASPNLPRRWPGVSEKHQIQISNLLADLFLFFFGCVAFSTAWEALAQSTPIQPDQSLIVQYFGVAILFLMIYPPVRGVYSIEELFSYRPLYMRRTNQISFLAALIAAMISIPRT